MIQNPKERLARDLFFETGKTQKEIANIIGVSEKTIYLWMKGGDWKRLRSASRIMPSMIVENFYAQVQELNDDIRERDKGKRYPTVQEAEVFRKMIISITRIQKGHTQPEYMEMMQKFLTWLMSQNHGMAQDLTDYANTFLKSRSVEGFLPFDIEHEPEPLEQDPTLTLNTITRIFPLLRGDSSESTNVDLEQGCVLPGPAPELNQETGKPETDNTSSPSERPGEVNSIAPNKPKTNNTSFSLGEGRDEATTQHVTPSPFMEKGSGDEAKPETTRNCTEMSYNNPAKDSIETPTQKPEIQNPPEISNNTSSPSERSGEVETNTSFSLGEGRDEATTQHVTPSPFMEKGPGDEVSLHIPGQTYISPDGLIKPLPPYLSKEYYDIPLYLRERLYTMTGDPKTDFTKGNANF